MDNKKLEKWEADESAAFSGWDFSYLDGRWQEEPLPWDYGTIVARYRKPAHKLLDIGTGGGEFLLSLNHPHKNTFVTESYPPNIALCKQTLAPKGITVAGTSSTTLPFDDSTFDIVINRHEAYDLAEVKRVLKKDGVFVTQQVGGHNNNALSKKLIAGSKPKHKNWHLQYALAEAKDKGFAVLEDGEAYPVLRFLDVGAVVYFAKVIEWEFPGFSVQACQNALMDIEKKMQRDGYYESTEHRFMLVLKKVNL